MILNKNKKYKAAISLNMLEQFASNQMIEQKISSLGFADIKIQGTGKDRVGTATYLGETKNVDLPPQILELKEMD